MEAPENTSKPLIFPLRDGSDSKPLNSFRAPAIGSGREKRPSSLDLWTLDGCSSPLKRPLDEPYLELTVRDCGGGNANAVLITREKGFRPGRGRKNSCASKKSRSEMLPEDLKRSVCRARKDMQEKCLCLAADHQCVLTFRGCFTDRALAWKIFGEWVRLMKVRFPTFQYVVVMELHKSGGIHLHLALHGFWPAKSLRFLWHRAIRRKDPDACWEKSPGNVDLSKPRYGSVRRNARYLGKYYGKDFAQGDLNSKRYACSKGIAKPNVTVLYLDIGTPRLAVVRYLQSLCGGELARLPFECQVAGFQMELFELQTATMPP